MFKRIFTREVFDYILWGVLTSLWNIGIFQGLLYAGVDFRIANAAALITTKIWAYVVNKFFVFKSRCETPENLFFEIIRFILTRGFTMLVDFFGLIVLAAFLHPRIGKIITTVVVVVLNYILGKFHVFKTADHSNSLL